MADMNRVLQRHSTDQPEVHDIAAEMRALADSYGARLLVGEIYLPVDKLMDYYGPRDRPGVHLPFNFQLIDAPWDARTLHHLIADYEAALPAVGWPNWVLGNHDRPRAATRLGEAQARVAAMLLLTLRGTPTIYYGDEIGLADVAIPADRIHDPREVREPGLGFGRDPVRTPMPWDASANAGFSTTEPWLPLNPDWPTRNVSAQMADPHSMLSLYRALLALRRAHPALATGAMRLIEAEGDMLAWERQEEGERMLVALNLGFGPGRLALPPGRWQTLLSTRPDLPAVPADMLLLRPDEGLILLHQD